MTDERDPLFDRAVAELRRVPEVDRGAIERVALAAAASRLSAADDTVVPPRHRRAPAWIAGVVAAVIVAGFVLRSGRPRDAVPVDSPPPSGLVMHPVAASAAANAAPVARQFVFIDRSAHSVSVVGDFNGWNPKSAPMSRSPGGDLWSTTIPVLPGRHTFAYIVDDSIFMLDPRMPKTRDPDLGTEGSVVLVGRP